MNIVITGASSGLGSEIFEKLVWHHTVINWSLDSGVDVRSSESLLAAAKSLRDSVDILINCAGVNHLDWIPDLKEEDWDRVMDTNAKGIFLTTKTLLPHIRSGGLIINIVSNAAHVPMTCSLAYNASKGAALIMTKQMARELKKTHNLTIFSVSPNRMCGTKMSDYIDEAVCRVRGWTPEHARAYQKAALPSGKETPRDVVADFIVGIIESGNYEYLNGCDLPFGA